MTLATSSNTRFTFAEYQKMADAGVFDLSDDRVELMNGRIYHVAPQRDPHMFAVAKGTELLLRVRKANELVLIQGTLRLDRFSAPDPDLQWFDVPFGTPEHKRPLPMLLIEVSHTTYRRDSGVKLRLYARHGILDYWIVNIPQQRVEVYRTPINPTPESASAWRYDSVHHFTQGQSIALLQRPSVSIMVDDLLP
jgi:Uma2 family endonuclease